jgi:hypothetical protein
VAIGMGATPWLLVCRPMPLRWAKELSGALLRARLFLPSGWFSLDQSLPPLKSAWKLRAVTIIDMVFDRTDQ